MHARSLVLSLGVSLIAVTAVSPRAFAQSASVQAQSLFDDGRRLIKAGKIAEACAAFEASQKLDPVVTTLLNLAECRERNRQLATAWGLFVDANRTARANKNAKLAKVASNHARKLEPRVSKLTITVAAEHRIPGLEILRGDEPVNAAGWNHALPIDGGTYTITARAAGHTPWSVTRTIKPESDVQTVDIPRLVEARPAPVASGATGARPPGTIKPSPSPSETPDPGSSRGTTTSVASREEAPATTEPVDPPRRSRSLVLPIALGAGALALGGAALALHFSANSTYEESRMKNDQDLWDSANNKRYAAQAVGGAAVVCAGVAVYLYIRGRDESPASTTAMPLVSPQLAGLAVVGHW